MFSIFDGRDYFYQWDIDRKLIIDDNTITQVHFCNRTSDCSLVCEVYNEDGLRLVNVPNIILQDNWDINVYAYDSNYTKHSEKFEVRARTKPDNYVYTPEELKTWEQLDTRIDEIEEKGISDETVANAVENYLNDNPITGNVISVNGKQGVVELDAADVGALPADTVIPSTTGLATEKYVDDKVAAIPQPDLSGYATKNDISGLATTNYVDEKVSNVKVDLTGYATESFVSEEIAKAQLAGGDVDLSGYYTKSETDTAISNAVAAIPQPDLTDYAKKSEIPDTTGFATTGYVDDKVAAIEVPSLDGYATEDYVDEAIANIPTSGGSVAVDGKTIIQNDDGTISTSLGGGVVETKTLETAFDWVGNVSVANPADIVDATVNILSGAYNDVNTIYITIDGKEYVADDVSSRGTPINYIYTLGVENCPITEITVNTRTGVFKSFTLSDTATGNEVITAIKMGRIGISRTVEYINYECVPIGSGLNYSVGTIAVNSSYINNLIANYMTTNYPSAEEVSY